MDDYGSEYYRVDNEDNLCNLNGKISCKMRNRSLLSYIDNGFVEKPKDDLVRRYDGFFPMHAAGGKIDLSNHSRYR